MKNKSIRSTRFVTMLALLWVFLSLTACIQPESTTTPPATGGNAATLENSKWRLTLFGAPDAETPVVAGNTITLEFSTEGRAGGSSGCNTYGGSYEVAEDQLVFGEMVSTMMACTDQAVMDQEMTYLQALQSAGRFEVNGDALMVWYDNEQGVLRFTAE